MIELRRRIEEQRAYREGYIAGTRQALALLERIIVDVGLAAEHIYGEAALINELARRARAAHDPERR